MSSPIQGQTPGDGSGQSQCAGYSVDTQVVPLSLVQTGVAYIILYSTLSTLLFVLLCAVFMKNGLGTSRRNSPVVWILGASMLLGVLGSVLDTVFWATQMLRTVTAPDQIASYYIASNAMLFLVPWVVRWAMCIRIASFYPENLAAARKRFAIVFLPAVMQIANLVLFCVVLQDGYRTVKDKGGVTGGQLSGYRLKLDLILYGAVLLCSLYYTSLLLPKFIIMGGSTSLGSPSLLGSGRVESKWWAFTKRFFYAVSFSYLLPTLFDIALIVVFCTVQGRTLGFMLVINVYVHVFGGTLACLSSAGKWTGKQGRFYPKESDGSGSGMGSADRRRLSELATATGIQGNSSGRLRNFHHLRAHRNNNNSQSLQEGAEGLHPITTIGGDVILAMPPSMPISESKLLLHQRRRVSLAIAASSEKMKMEDPYYHMPPHLSTPSSGYGYGGYGLGGAGAGAAAGGGAFGASAGGGCTCGAAAAAAAAANAAPPAHIDLPPPSASLDKEKVGTESSGSVSSALSAAEKRSPPQHQKRRTPDNDLSPRSLDPNRITRQRGKEEEDGDESSNDDTLVLRDRPSGRRRDSEDGAAADARATARTATSPADRGDRQVEILADEDDATAATAARTRARQENRRSSDATLLNSSSSIGTPTSGVLH